MLYSNPHNCVCPKFQVQRGASCKRVDFLTGNLVDTFETEHSEHLHPNPDCFWSAHQRWITFVGNSIKAAHGQRPVGTEPNGCTGECRVQGPWLSFFVRLFAYATDTIVKGNQLDSRVKLTMDELAKKIGVV